MDKSTSSSGAAAASKSSKVPHCYSDDEDRWCPTAEDGPVVFSSLVDPEIEAANAKRRQLKSEVKKLKAEKAKYDEENSTCIAETEKNDAKRAVQEAECETLSKQLDELKQQTTELEAKASADTEVLSRDGEELKQLLGETVATMSISELNVLQSTKIALLDQIYERVLEHAVDATEQSGAAQAALRDAEAACAQMRAYSEQSTRVANECRAQVLGVQQVNEELQAKNKELSLDLVNMKIELKKEIPKRMICMQCEARARSVVLLPCRHLAICNGPFCRNVPTCPVCKQPVEKRLLINL